MDVDGVTNLIFAKLKEAAFTINGAFIMNMVDGEPFAVVVILLVAPIKLTPLHSMVMVALISYVPLLNRYSIHTPIRSYGYSMMINIYGMRYRMIRLMTWHMLMRRTRGNNVTHKMAHRYPQ